MRTTRFILAAFLLAAPAVAQPASDKSVADYVEAHSAITHLGKIARWDDPVCPGVMGLPAGFTKFVVGRVREVATAAGAAVDAKPECRVNVQIIFTTKPQSLLDEIRTKQPVLLGYFNNDEQAAKMATVTRPIQSWYETATVDMQGAPVIDSRFSISGGSATTPNAQASAGSHLGDGLRSEFYHVTIVADPSKLGDHEIGALADYIAVLALSQPSATDACLEMPSILDMTAAGCRAATPILAISKADSAYLKALYHIRPGGTLRAQKDAIGFGMKDALAAR